MNRRALIVSLLVASGSAFAQSDGLASPGTDKRRLLRQINRALPGIWSDHHVALARACDRERPDFADSLRSALGSDMTTVLSLDPRDLRSAYRQRRSDDLKSLNLVILDGYLLASAEYDLGMVLRVLDRT